MKKITMDTKFGTDTKLSEDVMRATKQDVRNREALKRDVLQRVEALEAQAFALNGMLNDTLAGEFTPCDENSESALDDSCESVHDVRERCVFVYSLEAARHTMAFVEEALLRLTDLLERM